MAMAPQLRAMLALKHSDMQQHPLACLLERDIRVVGMHSMSGTFPTFQIGVRDCLEFLVILQKRNFRDASHR